MSVPNDCCCQGPTVQTVNVPGPQGATGPAAYTTVTSDFTIPAIGGSAFMNVGSTAALLVGQNIFAGANFQILSFVNSTTLNVMFVSLPNEALSPGNTIPAGTKITSGTGVDNFLSLQNISSLTDNTTGAAGTTLAAGVGIYTLSILVNIALGTTAATYLNAATLGHAFKLLGWSFLTTTAVTGALASRVFSLSVSGVTVPGSVTVSLAASAAVGTITPSAAFTQTPGSAVDTLSLSVASGGTSITAGEGLFILTIQNMDTANAFASISALSNDLLAALKPV